MCLVNSVVHPYVENFVIIFVDDIFIYSENEEENVNHLVVVLRLQRDHQLHENLSK